GRWGGGGGARAAVERVGDVLAVAATAAAGEPGDRARRVRRRRRERRVAERRSVDSERRGANRDGAAVRARCSVPVTEDRRDRVHPCTRRNVVLRAARGRNGAATQP